MQNSTSTSVPRGFVGLALCVAAMLCVAQAKPGSPDSPPAHPKAAASRESVNAEGPPISSDNAAAMEQWERIAGQHAMGVVSRMPNGARWTIFKYQGHKSRFAEIFTDMVGQALTKHRTMLESPAIWTPNNVTVSFDYVPEMRAIRIKTVVVGNDSVLGSYSSHHNVDVGDNGVIIPR